MTVVVVTDSGACLSTDLLEQYGIRVVPLHVLVADQTLREGVDEIPEDLTADGITTSAASPGEVKIAYARAFAASDGDGVVGVHLSRKLSATWEAARQVEQSVAGKVRIVDSLGAGIGSGFPALAAARCANAGGTLDEVYDAAVSVAERQRIFIVVDRLDQLRRGGRISTAAALLGTALSMKPLLHMVDGRLVLKEKTRTSSKALAKLVDAVTAVAAAGPVALGVQHLTAPERAEDVVAQLQARLPDIAELVVAEFGPTLGIHVGPGAIGVSVVPGGAGDVAATV